VKILETLDRIFSRKQKQEVTQTWVSDLLVDNTNEIQEDAETPRRREDKRGKREGNLPEL